MPTPASAGYDEGERHVSQPTRRCAGANMPKREEMAQLVKAHAALPEKMATAVWLSQEREDEVWLLGRVERAARRARAAGYPKRRWGVRKGRHFFVRDLFLRGPRRRLFLSLGP